MGTTRANGAPPAVKTMDVTRLVPEVKVPPEAVDEAARLLQRKKDLATPP